MPIESKEEYLGKSTVLLPQGLSTGVKPDWLTDEVEQTQEVGYDVTELYIILSLFLLFSSHFSVPHYNAHFGTDLAIKGHLTGEVKGWPRHKMVWN